MRLTFGYRELLTKEIVEAWRTYRIAVLCALYLALGIGVPLLIRFLPSLLRMFGATGEPAADDLGVADLVNLLVSSVTLFGGIAAILVTMGAIADERRRGLLALVLSRPVSRAAVLWAKFVAVGMMFGLATVLAVLAAWLYAALFFDAQAVLPWGQLGAVLWLSVMVQVAITLLGSVLARTPLGAAAVGLAFLVAMSLAATVVSLARFLPAGLPDLARAVALENVSPDLAPTTTIGASLLVIAVALGVAWWQFRRMDV
jgi:ABC-2 type transport system permease protein